MSEEQPKPEEQEEARVDLAKELRELGVQIQQAMRSFMVNDQSQRIQQDISNGMREIGTQVQQAINALKDDPRVHNLAERGQQAVNEFTESPPAKEFQEVLARGVAQLNEQLAAFVTRTRGGEAPPASGAQSVTIESDEPPATGETTRLEQ